MILPVRWGLAARERGAVEHGARLFTLATCHHAPEVYGGIAEAEALLRGMQRTTTCCMVLPHTRTRIRHSHCRCRSQSVGGPVLRCVALRVWVVGMCDGHPYHYSRLSLMEPPCQ